MSFSILRFPISEHGATYRTREIITGLPYDFSHLITTHFAAFYKKHITDLRTLSARTRSTRHLRRRIHPSQQGRLGRKMEESMKHYEADISVRRVGIITAPRIPPDHPSVRHSSCLHREVFPAADITEARQTRHRTRQNPNTPEFLKCLDFYFVPFKTLEWENWQDPREPEGETQIHSCESQPFLNGVFKWIVKILVYEVDADC